MNRRKRGPKIKSTRNISYAEARKSTAHLQNISTSVQTYENKLKITTRYIETQTILSFHPDDNMQIETAPQIPNTSYTTSSKTTSTHENRTTLQEQAKPKTIPHTKITLQRSPPPTKNNNKPNTQVNRLPKGSTDPIILHNKFGSFDTMDVDLDKVSINDLKNKKSNYTSPPS